MSNNYVRLDTLKTSSLAWRILLFIFFGILLASVGFLSPRPLKRYLYSAYECPVGWNAPFDASQCSGVELSKGGVWTTTLKDIHPMNQFILLELQVENAQYEQNFGYVSELGITLSLLGSENEEDFAPILSNQTHVRTLSCPKGERWCEKISLLHLAWLQHNTYTISVDFKNTPLSIVGDVAFHLVTVNPQYTEFTVITKAIYVLIAIEAFVLWRRKMREVDAEDWNTAQYWISSLFVGLILFNDPFAITSTMGLQPSWVAPLLSFLIQMSFLFALLLFWIVILEIFSLRSVLSQDSPQHPREWWKYAAVGSAWLAVSITIVWLRVEQANDPMLTYASDFPYFGVVHDLVLAIAGLYVFWLLHVVLKARGDLERDQPNYRRFYFVLWSSIVLVSALVLGAAVGALPYANEGQVVHHRGWYFTSMLALVNCYVFLTAFVFLPSYDRADSVYEALYKRSAQRYPDDL